MAACDDGTTGLNVYMEGRKGCSRSQTRKIGQSSREAKAAVEMLQLDYFEFCHTTAKTKDG